MKNIKQFSEFFQDCVSLQTIQIPDFQTDIITDDMRVKLYEEFKKPEPAMSAVTYTDYIAESLNNKFGTSGGSEPSGRSGTSGGSLYVNQKPKPPKSQYEYPYSQTEQIKQVDDFGSWTKEKKSLPLYEKWMIGIAICSLIIGIVTVFIMLIPK